MKFNYETIRYGDKLIIKSGSIIINPSCITVVTGESGSGKTTLLKYLYNDSIQNKDFYSIFSFCFQENYFIEDLTLKNHIDLIKDLTLNDIETEELIKKLNLNEALNKYPLQLSGGEKKRAGFLLCILKNSHLFIFDEPTASLNGEYSKIYIDIINRLKEKGKGFLIFTHDNQIEKIGDIHYQISDKKLNCITEDNSIELNENSIISKNIKVLPKYLYLMKKHQKLYKKVLNLSVIIALAFVCFTCSISTNIYNTQQEILKQMKSQQIVVYKPSPHAIFDGVASYTMMHELPFSEEEIKEIKNIEYVENIEWRYDTIEPNYAFNNDITNVKYDPDNAKKDYTISIYDNSTEIHSFSTSDDVTVSTYLQSDKQNNNIEIDFKNEGVYISNVLAEELLVDSNLQSEDLKGKFVEIDISVPLYNTYGIQQGVTENEAWMYLYNVTIEHKKVRLPIAGILKFNSMGLVNGFARSLYVNRKDFETLLNKEKKENKTVYIMNGNYTEFYINEIPSSETNTPERTAEYTDWTPTAYTIQVDGIENIPAVIKGLENQGYEVLSEYMDQGSILIGIESMEKTFILASSLLAILTIIYVIGITYADKKTNQNLNDFFRQLGFSKSEIKEIKKSYYIYNMLKHLVCICLCLVLIIPVYLMITNFIFIPTILGIVLTLLLVCICFLVIPIIINNND